MKRALIIEDVAETRRWLEGIVGEAFAGCAVTPASSLAAARAALTAEAFDIVLLDLGLPDGCGLTLLPDVRAHSPHAIVVVATVSGDDAQVVSALSAGVQGYLLKDHDSAILVAQLRQVTMGIPALSPSIAHRIIHHFSTTGPIEIDAKLTDRERDVLDLIGLGLRNVEVAQQLDIAESTVAGYIKSVYTKLGISSRAEAATYANRLGPRGL